MSLPKDSLDPRRIAEYETNLANLIRDVRVEFASDLPIIIGELGQKGAFTTNYRDLAIREAQVNVAESPEFSAFTTLVITTRYLYPEEPSFDLEFHYYGRAGTLSTKLI